MQHRVTTRNLAVRPATTLFRALGDETRRRIVALLSHRELCVCHIQEALGVSQPHASRQLGVLRSAGVVEARRDGSWVYYRIADQLDPLRKRHLSGILRSFADESSIEREVAALV